MTDEKINEVLDMYEASLSQSYEPFESDFDCRCPSQWSACCHVLSMIPKMREFLRQGRREKVMRWLGFIQGILWMMGDYNLRELMDHNRPDAGSEAEEK